MKSEIRYRIYLLVMLVVIIPLGFGCKYYAGPFQFWVHNSLGGVFYEIFWCFIIALLFTELSSIQIAVWVFIITSLLEVMQLWHPPFLEMIRNTFLGRTLIGTSFVWGDFIYYFIGCFVSILLLRIIHKKGPEVHQSLFDTPVNEQIIRPDV